MENLIGEQQKRMALLDAYEAKTAPEREIRNGGIDQHEQEYRENGCNCSPVLKQPVAICKPD